MAPKCRKMAPRWFQEPSWPLLVALGPLLGRSWPLLAALGSLLVSWADLGASWGDLGAILSDLGRSWGDLWRPREVKLRGGRRSAFAGWHPLETFCRKFLPSRDLQDLLFFRDLRLSPSTRRAALGAADLERPAGGDRRPLRKGSSACSMCEAGVV